MPIIDVLVTMATEIKQNALHNFLLNKWNEQTSEFTKKFKMKVTPLKINKLKAELTSTINEGGNIEDIAKPSQKQQLAVARSAGLRLALYPPP